MKAKHLIWIGALVGLLVGVRIPMLFGAQIISVASILTALIVGTVGA